MIKSFLCSETELIFNGHRSRKLPSDIQKTAYRKLRYIDSAGELNDLRIPPANRLESLKGNRKGQYSIRINKQWRICFVFKGDNAYDVEIIDYH